MNQEVKKKPCCWLKLGVSLTLFCVVAAALSVRTWRLLNVPGQPNEDEWGMQDFRDAVYYPTRAWLDGENPYDTERYKTQYAVRQMFPLYSPLILLLHLPFGLMPFVISEAIYFAFMLAMTLALSWLGQRFCGLRITPARVLTVGAAILLSRPGHMNLIVGNVAFQAALLSILALHFARRRPWLAGLALGLLTFKQTFGVPMAALMLCRRDFRAVGWGTLIGTAGTAFMVATLAYNDGGVTTFVKAIDHNHLSGEEQVGIADVRESWARIDTFSAVVHLSGMNPPPAVKIGMGLALVMAAGFTLWQLGEDSESDGADGPGAAIICLTTLACVYHQNYDAVLLLTPMLAMLMVERTWWRSVSPAYRWFVIAMMAVPLTNYVSSTTGIRVFRLSGVSLSVAKSASGIAILCGLIACCVAVLRSRRNATADGAVTASEPSQTNSNAR